MTVLAADFAIRLGALDLEVALEVDDRGLVLVGPNGAGKTSVLLALLAARRPSRGRIAIASDVLFDSADDIDRPTEERGIAYVPQSYALFPHLTAAQNVAFGIRGPRHERIEKARSLLERLGVGSVADRRPAALSGGEQQRVALARALAPSPRAILLDEPLAALDLPLRDPMRQELRQFLRSIDVPSVVVTHDRVDALTLGDRMAVLSGGYIRQVGPVPEVFSRPIDLAVAASVGVETVVPGEIVDSSDGLVTVRVGASQIRVAQPSIVARSVFACIRAEDVTLETSPRTEVSARNQLAGRVTSMQPEGAVVRVTVDCGFSLSALITRPACAELGLRENSAITAVVKATAVHLIPRENDS